MKNSWELTKKLFFCDFFKWNKERFLCPKLYMNHSDSVRNGLLSGISLDTFRGGFVPCMAMLFFLPSCYTEWELFGKKYTNVHIIAKSTLYFDYIKSCRSCLCNAEVHQRPKKPFYPVNYCRLVAFTFFNGHFGPTKLATCNL